jgi:DNA-binding transcriptional MerR regulator
MFKTKTRQSAPAAGERSFSSADVSRLSGVSLRQLQWWDEQKVVSPRHEGHKRIYLTEEVVEISVIAELRRKGFSLQKIRRVLRFLQREMGKHVSEILSAESDLHLLTDGKSIYLEDSNERIIDLLKNAKQPMFLVSVTDQVRRLTVTPRKPVKSETPATARKSKAV